MTDTSPKTVISPIQEQSIFKKRFICEYCAKPFPKPSALKVHIYTHTGEKPFKCERPDCNKAFSCGSNLRRHFKTHKRVLRHSRKVDEIYAAICPNTCSTTPKAPLVYVPQGSHAAMDYFTGESFLPITPSPQYQGLTASSWCQPAIAQRDAHIISATMLVSLFPELLGTSDGALLHIPLGHFDTILKERSTDTANGLQISIE